MATSRRLSAIVFTDMAGSTELAQRDERTALSLIEEQETLALPIVAEHHGRLVKSTGDGLLMEFPSALDAIESAVEFQRRVHARNAAPGTAPLEIRIGVHLGDVQPRGDDIFGDAVNVAARVESMAEPGGVCVSESLYNQIRNKVSYTLERLGAQRLKGVSEPMELYRVVLPWTKAGGATHSDSSARRLAVLPLANISPDPNDAYFADGLTEELIAVLSKIPGLRVIARTSVTPYKSSGKSITQIGAELGVSAVLEGSVRKAGDRLRITLQLIEVASQEHIWAEKYDRQLSDIFAIQTEVAESTAKSIRVELSERAREFIRRPPTRSLTAYELYLRATLREDDLNLDPSAFRETLAMLEAAIEGDPEFAMAHAQLGYRLVQGAGDFMAHREGFARARTSISRALELDPDLSDAHAALASLVMQDEHDWARAEQEFLRALSLNPSNSMTRASYGGLLRVLGRLEEAEDQYRAAIETNPNSWIPRWNMVELALLRGDEALARERAKQFLNPDPNPAATHIAFAMMYARAGRKDDARQELTAAGRPSHLLLRLARSLVLAVMGEPEEGRTLLAELTGGDRPEFVPVEYLAGLYVVAGENEKALNLIEESARHQESGLWLRHSIPVFDPIRDDPRFVAVMRSFHLPEPVTERATTRRAESHPERGP